MIDRDKHNKTLISSIGKLRIKYITSGGLLNSGLKYLDVIENILNSCYELPEEDRERLERIYNELKAKESLCNGHDDLLYPNNDFSVIGGNQDNDKFEVSYAKPPTITMGVETIIDYVKNNGMFSDSYHINLIDLKNGHYFNMSKGGRLVVFAKANLVRSTIYNIMGLDITDTFERIIDSNGVMFISKDILTTGKMYLKIN